MTASSSEVVRSEVEARILVVDDEPEVASLVAEALREADPSWQVDAETDPIAALDRLTEGTFDCLVTDLVMPSLGGIDLAQKARAIHEHLALVAITGRASLESSIKAMRAGFSDFVQKPFDLETLHRTVSRCLHQVRQQAEVSKHIEQLTLGNATLEAAQAQLREKLDIAGHDLVLSSKRMIRQIEDVAQVAAVARSIVGVVEVEDLLGLCAEIIGSRVACLSSTVGLHETQQNAGALMVRAHPAEDESPTLSWLPAPMPSGVLCRAAMTGKCVHIENIATSRLVHPQERQFWRDGRLLVVPIPCGKTTVAVAVVHRALDDNDFGMRDVKHVTALTPIMGPAIRTARLYYRQRCQVCSCLEAVAEAAENRDGYRKGHSGRVLAYAMLIAKTMELPPVQVGALQIAARLHDIGWVAIPEAAVNHPGALTRDQWAIVRRHADAGASFLEPLEFLGEVSQIIRGHHESYDGTGYPDRKAGEEIPPLARVIGVADALDAMTSPRPHRQALSLDEALEQIGRLSGEQFDPRAAEAILNVPADSLAEIQASGR
jgi:response regulator RpfG family c-di-GMP phosphodiesterase